MEKMNLNETRAKYVQQVEENSPILSALQSLVIGDSLNDEEVKAIREFRTIQEYLDLPLNDPAENQLKKVFIAAVVAAHQKGIKKLPEGYNYAESIASIVDEGLTRVKVAYQVAEGMVNPIDAETAINDRLVIRAAAIVNEVVDKLVKKANEYVNKVEKNALSVSDRLVAMGLQRVSDVVCVAVSRIYPPAVVLVPYVKRFIAFVTPVAQQAVKKGIKMVTDFARNTIKQVASTVKVFSKKILEKLLG